MYCYIKIFETIKFFFEKIENFLFFSKNFFNTKNF